MFLFLTPIFHRYGELLQRINPESRVPDACARIAHELGHRSVLPGGNTSSRRVLEAHLVDTGSRSVVVGVFFLGGQGTTQGRVGEIHRRCKLVPSPTSSKVEKVGSGRGMLSEILLHPRRKEAKRLYFRGWLGELFSTPCLKLWEAFIQALNFMRIVLLCAWPVFFFGELRGNGLRQPFGRPAVDLTS